MQTSCCQPRISPGPGQRHRPPHLQKISPCAFVTVENTHTPPSRCQRLHVQCKKQHTSEDVQQKERGGGVVEK